MQNSLPTATSDVEPWFFEGRDLRVALRLFADSEKLFITFTGRAANPPVPTGFGEKLFLKRRISAIHFISKANHWWQTAELDQAIESLVVAGVLNDRQQIILYGSSMGAYASLLRSRQLNAKQVLAVSPQYSIDRKIVPFEYRWRSYAATLKFDFDDMGTGLDKKAQIFIVVDTFFDPDKRHLDLIQRHRPVNVIRVAFAGHNTARALEEVGLASRMVIDVAGGEFDPISYVRDYRRERRRSSLFWHGLAVYLAERGRRGWALAAASLAAHLMLVGGRMRDPVLRYDILVLALELACEANSETLALRWLAEIEKAPIAKQHLTALRARVALVCRRNDEAIAFVRQLIADGFQDTYQAIVLTILCETGRFAKGAGLLKRVESSEDIPFLLSAGRALLNNDRIDEAISTLSRALVLAPRSKEARILLAKAQIASGQPRAAKTTLGTAIFSSSVSPALAEHLAQVVRALYGKALAQEVKDRAVKMSASVQSLTESLYALEASFTAQEVGSLCAAAFRSRPVE